MELFSAGRAPCTVVGARGENNEAYEKGVPCGIIGARLYYVAMTWDLFRNNPVSILYIWEGGIAIYVIQKDSQNQDDHLAEVVVITSKVREGDFKTAVQELSNKSSVKRISKTIRVYRK